MNYTLQDMYKFYRANGGKALKSEYKNICQDYNIHCMNHLIYKGGKIELGGYMSELKIITIKRKYNNKLKLHKVDWKASNEYKQELLDSGKQLYDHETGKGIKWLIYIDTPYFTRFYWNKGKAKFKNKNFYRFIPSRGAKGNKEKLKEFLAKHELNYQIYDRTIYDLQKY
jgi:hypothetical protein